MAVSSRQIAVGSRQSAVVSEQSAVSDGDPAFGRERRLVRHRARSRGQGRSQDRVALAEPFLCSSRDGYQRRRHGPELRRRRGTELLPDTLPG